MLSSIKFINIYGPTASGKTALSLKLAEKIGGIIINFDSCQFRNHLQALTMCPPPHLLTDKEYLFSFLSPEETFTAGDFLEACKKIIENTPSEQKIIFVGGSGFYLLCLLKGMKGPINISAHIKTQVRENSLEENWRLLNTLDPHHKIHKNDIYRLENYLRFHLQYGYSMSSVVPTPFLKKEVTLNVFLNPPQETLLQNIQERTLSTFSSMQEEVAAFPNFPNNIIGYAEVKSYLRGEMTKNATIDAINIRTRQYAKTQRTFLKNKIDHNLILNSPKDVESILQVLK